jgi:alpha-beta hydrolase superfamily lysophospholipase
LEAAEALAQHLRKLQNKHPDARQFLIAHSHGGNIALSSTLQLPESHNVHGVACLVGETAVAGWFRVRSRVFSHGQIPGVEPTLAITVVVERVEDESELKRAGVK